MKIYWITKLTTTGYFLPFFSSLLKKDGKRIGELSSKTGFKPFFSQDLVDFHHPLDMIFLSYRFLYIINNLYLGKKMSERRVLQRSWILEYKSYQVRIPVIPREKWITTLRIYQYWIFHHIVIETCFEML